MVNETRAPVHATAICRRRLPIPSAPRSASRAWRRSARSRDRPPARVNELYEVADSLSHQAGAHALRVGVDFLYNDDTITFPRTIRGSYSFSSLANFLAGTYNNSGYHADLRQQRCPADQSQCRLLRAGRVEGESASDAEHRPALRSGVPENHRHRDQQRVSRAPGLPGRLLRRAAPWCAAATDCFTIAFRCARWPTRCCRPETPPT